VQAGGPGLYQDALISGALQELSTPLCRGNAYPCWSGAHVTTQAALCSHTGLKTGLNHVCRGPVKTTPSAEAVVACFEPVCGFSCFWFGFAEHCVALLSAVCVGFPVVLFPAGGPFLPSLSVKI
jgi:hypothetical protein